jgi:putative lipoprotein
MIGMSFRGRRLRLAGRAARPMLWAAAGLAAAACLPRTRPAAPDTTDILSVYSCPGDFRFSVREFGEVATVRLPMQTIAIPRVRVGSGSRYARDGAELRKTGETASLTVGAERHSGCAGQRAATPWDVARLLGVDYRAVGSEPTWSIEMENGKYMRFAIEGASAMHMPLPEPTGDAARRIYRTPGDIPVLEVMLEEKACREPTLPDPLPHTVTVTYQGIPYRGCGTAIDAA